MIAYKAFSTSLVLSTQYLATSSVAVVLVPVVVATVLSQWNTGFQMKDEIYVNLYRLGFMGELHIHKPHSSEVQDI